MRTAKIMGALLAASVLLSGCYGDRYGRPGHSSDRPHGGHHGHGHGHGNHHDRGDRDRGD